MGRGEKIMPWNPDHYKNVNWNTSSTRKSEPPANKKTILKYHAAWARANGYKPQAASSKRLKKDTVKK